MLYNDLEPGTRIELHPATDWWMRGARYGTVVKRNLAYPGPATISVKLDKVKKTIKVSIDDIGKVIS